MKKFLLTAAFGKYAGIFGDHDSRMRTYAAHWGFAYEPTLFEVDVSPHHSPIWSQIRLVMDKLATCADGDIVSWIDADVCIIDGSYDLMTTRDIGITFDEWHVDVTPDAAFDADVLWSLNRINAGVFSIRCSEFSRSFIRRVWNRSGQCDSHGWMSQIAFGEEINAMSHDDKRLHLQMLPREINVTLSSLNSGIRRIMWRHYAAEQHVMKFASNPSIHF